MNEQVKQFYKDHQNRINIVAGVVTTGALAVFAKRFVNANTIRNCDYLLRDDGTSIILIHLKNGAVKAFSSTDLTK